MHTYVDSSHGLQPISFALPMEVTVSFLDPGDAEPSFKVS